MSNRIPKPNRRGVAMVIVLLIIMALSLLASGVILITTTEVFVTRNEAFGREAFHTAEAGLAHAQRLLRSLNSKDQITAMYQASGAQSGVPIYRGAVIGYKFTNLSSPVHVIGILDASHRYELYVQNNDPTEVDGTGKPIEADGIFMIRSIGYSNYTGGGYTTGMNAQPIPASRRILEQEFMVKLPMMDTTIDSFGGGSGNISSQRTF